MRRDLPSRDVWAEVTAMGAAMRQSEFDKLSAALDRAEFALKELRKKEVALRRKRHAAKPLKEITDLNLEATELLQQLRKISDAVHTGNPAPHLRLVPDKE
jgi:predicted  nucleic acid-binding Zn-ribbon protein